MINDIALVILMVISLFAILVIFALLFEKLDSDMLKPPKHIDDGKIPKRPFVK